MKEKFDITGMTCSACSSRVEKCVAKLVGDENVSVNLLTNSMQVELKDENITKEDIIQEVEKAGYGASPAEKEEGGRKILAAAGGAGHNQVEAQEKEIKIRLAVSFAFLIPLMYLSMGHMWGMPVPGFLAGHENAVSFAFTQFLLCLPVVYVNRQYFIKGFSTLVHMAPNMDSLIAIGSAASLVYGIFAIYRMSYGMGTGNMELVASYHEDLYFESAAMILTLITVGKYLEAKSKGRTSEALKKLMDMTPKMAIVEKDGIQQEVPAEEVKPGDIVIIKPGASVPVDGTVIEGSTSIDESAITGESIPVEKEKGMFVIAATINKTGFVRVRADKVGTDTTFSQIIRLVEDAGATKAPIAKLADKIAGIFVPVVIAIALVTAAVWLFFGADFEFALSCAICVMVISCPCALGLATPVAIMVGTGRGAENGILIKSGEALEVAHRADTVVMDKTGTITEGTPKVTDTVTMKGTENELIGIAAALEKKSEHPLAEAVIEYAESRNIFIKETESFEAVSGKGLTGRLDGSLCLGGNEKLMAQFGIDLSAAEDKINELAEQGKTPMLFAKGGELLGIIAVADVVKASSRTAVKELKDMGIDVIMLTGDNRKTAEGIGAELGLDSIIAEVLPQDKETVIAELQKDGKSVVMVGDGINDAPALVRADIGIAIGAGTDVAVESADIVLVKNDLRDVAGAIRLSKAVIRNIRQNLFWAFFYNCLGIPLAAGVFYSALGWRLSPMFGAAAMSFSSLFVVSNALRLRMFRLRKDDSGEESSSAGNPEDADEININEKMEGKNMVTLKIEGMMCQHCVKHVKDALEAFEGTSAEVNLEKKEAVVTGGEGVTVEQLKKAVEEAGYEVTEIK